MIYLLIAGKLISILLLPIFAPIALDKARSPNGNRSFKQRWLKNFYAYIVLFAGFAVIAIEICDKQRNLPSDSEALEFIELSSYEKEVNDYITQNNVSATSGEKMGIFRKFEFAEYAWEKNDQDEARKALEALEKGKDEQGPLLPIPSTVVYNNLGCVWFKIQRNKQFRSSDFLLKAKALSSNGSAYFSIVVANIEKLDRMVNKAD